MAEIINPKSSKEEFYKSLARPEKAFYASSPFWSKISKVPYEISEDSAYVMKSSVNYPSPYRPVPFEKFYESMNLLQKVGGAYLRDSDLTEPYDYDPTDWKGGNFIYVLANGVFMRLRKDTPLDKKKSVHTFFMLGESKAVENLAQNINLPHPFDDSKYPYRGLFKNNKEMPLQVLL